MEVPAYKTLAWVRENSLNRECMVFSSRQYRPSPMATGSLVSTLLQYGDRTLALNYANWLARTQRVDGSYLHPRCTTPSFFETGMALRGLVAALPEVPDLEPAIVQACDWLLSQTSPEGRLPLPPPAQQVLTPASRGAIVATSQLYVLPAINRAGLALDHKKYTEFSRHSRDYYLKNGWFPEFGWGGTLSHHFLYVQEALCDLDAEDMAWKGMRTIEPFQREDGAVPAYPDALWVCSPAQAQAAVVWQRLGEHNRALKALDFLSQHLNPSGGIAGSFGEGADYYTEEEISWAAKFFLDAAALQGWHSQDRALAETATSEAAAPSPDLSRKHVDKLLDWIAVCEADIARLEEGNRQLEQDLRWLRSTNAWRLASLYYDNRERYPLLWKAARALKALLPLGKK